MKKFILLILLAPALVAAQPSTAKSPWTGASVKSSLPPVAPIAPGTGQFPMNPQPGGNSLPPQSSPIFPGQTYPGQMPPGIGATPVAPNPELVQDNFSVVYLGKVNGKVFTKTKDGKAYALVSPSLYKRVPKIETTTIVPLDGNAPGLMSGASNMGNTNGLPSMVGGPVRPPISR